MLMKFDHSKRCIELREKLIRFMTDHVYPNERTYKEEVDKNGIEKNNRWIPTNTIENLKPLAKEQGLWNLFLPKSNRVPEGLSNYDYATLCEIMGQIPWAPEIFNCSAPDTGNMETLERYGTEKHKDDWLEPLLNGEIRSAFAMTEPDVASSDATNISTSIKLIGNDYIINGRKWWISGAGDPRCKIMIVMGKTDPNAPRHAQQSMILVPRDTKGVRVVRPLSVFGYDDAPHGHCEVIFENVKVPKSNLLLGEGRGFEIAQGRLGPGRIHHCMRAIGTAERALKLMCKRLESRTAFGIKISSQGVWKERIAESRILIDSSRLLVLKAAHMMDTIGNKEAKSEIAMIKVLAPAAAEKVIDWSIQAHGGGGVSDDFPVAQLWAHNRTLRLVDGPDEVHRNAVAKLELSKYQVKNK
tara:strand:+ start:2061 stop:3299 length:1239 start_codon:yes stop_codon:yes gene_type:complete